MPNLWWLWSFNKREKGSCPQSWWMSNPLRDLSKGGWDNYVRAWDCRCGTKKSFGRVQISVGQNLNRTVCLVRWKFRRSHLRNTSHWALQCWYERTSRAESTRTDATAIDRRHRPPERKIFINTNYKKWRRWVGKKKRNCGAQDTPPWRK